MRLYICGSISNGGRATPEERELNITRFYEAEAALKRAGYEVINPARRGHSALSWQGYMRLGLRDVADADGICILNGWEKSKGAMIEARLARDLDIPVKQLRGWL